MKRYFLITSSGAAATRWLGASLSRHPEICCSYGSGILTDTVDYEQESTPERLDRLAAFLFEHCVGPQATPRSIDRMFEELEAFRNARFYGNIHGETILTYRASVQAQPPLRGLTVANLVRHPVSRTEARYRSIQNDSEASVGMAKICDSQFQDRVNRRAGVADAILEQIGDIESTPERRRFVSAILETIGASTEFIQEGKEAPLHHYRIEDIKSSREHFRDFVVTMTKGELCLDPKWLDDLFTEKNLNFGRYRNDALAKIPAPTPEAQWRSWSEWQRRAFQSAMISSQFHLGFESVGYDLSFVGAPQPPLFPGWRQYSPPPPAAVSAPAMFNQMPA